MTLLDVARAWQALPWRDPVPPATVPDLARAESILGVALPVDYRACLLAVDGGLMSSLRFTFTDPDLFLLCYA
jgi:cell wall assembly regulator SMI1